VEQDLRLDRFGLRMIDHDPAWVWLGPSGESLLLSRDVRRTVAEIERFSTQDARTYREFTQVAMKALSIQDEYGAGNPSRPTRKTLVAAARGLAEGRVRRLLGAALTTSAAELIESTFASPQLRGAFATMASILGSITSDSSGIGILATAPLHRYGVARPVGGMQAVPDALVRCLEHHGGTVRLRSPVRRIVVDAGVARGVQLADGTEITAAQVVAAVPPQVTGELLAGSGVRGLGTLTRAPANAAGMGCLTVGMALRGRVALREHQRARPDGVDLRKPTMFSGSFEQVLAAEQRAHTGRIPTDPPWTATILSATDPTQAPDGEDSLYLYSPAPVRPNTGWAAARTDAEQALLRSVSPVLCGVTDLEIGRFVETPEDLHDRLGAANGCIYHLDQVVTRLGPLRPGPGWGGHQSRVPGLVLSGAGTHPGGGVSGLPGQLAAKAVIHASVRSKETR
jgi:phytoene dehydrogenase-like protein